VPPTFNVGSLPVRHEKGRGSKCKDTPARSDSLRQISRLRWIKDEDLNACKFANEYRITESDLKEFLERRRTRPEG
jgi:hypothetical protein